MDKRVESLAHIAASPEDVYAAISDVTRMGEWSEECRSCAWHEGCDGAACGSHVRWSQRIRRAPFYSTQGKVIEADPGRAFAFECSMMDFHYATWGYRIEPTDVGCDVTEWNEDLRPESVMEFSRQTSGVDDRTERNRQTMRGTLARLAERLES